MKTAFFLCYRDHMKNKLSLLFVLVLSATVGCAQAENEIDVQAIQDSQDEFRVKTQIVGACSLVPLKGQAWVDTKMPMLNGEAGADQISKDAYAEFMGELLSKYSELGEIGSVPLPGDDGRDTPIVDEIQSELFRMTVDLEGMANFNESSNFPVYFPPNNAKFLDDLISLCDEFDQIQSD